VCSAKEAEAAEKELKAKQKEHDWLQSQLDVLHQEMQDQRVRAEEQRKAEASAKQAEHSHGQLYHSYLKRALVIWFCTCVAPCHIFECDMGHMHVSHSLHCPARALANTYRTQDAMLCCMQRCAV